MGNCSDSHHRSPYKHLEMKMERHGDECENSSCLRSKSSFVFGDLLWCIVCGLVVAWEGVCIITWLATGLVWLAEKGG